MKTSQILAKVIVLIGILAMPFASILSQAAPASGQATKIEAVVVARDGKDLAVHSDLGDITVTLTETTKIQQISGLLGFSRQTMGVETLIPGLRITIETEPGSKTTANSVKFYEDDLKTAQQMKAALAVPQKRIAEQEQIIKAQEQQIAANKRQNETQEQKIADATAERATLNKRFGDLADYDMKSELTVLFDVNSANLSAKAKEDIKALAATAKTFKGYLIQVAGFADSTGSASHNQNLSDRRADSVATYLQQECDVAISRVLAPAAMGTSKPIAANETEKGRAENRRVTVKILVNRGIAQ